jgi:LmbE family N-acetylglucosaminyl deacetylase
MHLPVTRFVCFLTLDRLDFERSKTVLRRFAVRFCHFALRQLTPAYVFQVRRAVIFAPHQDDETLGCGGLISRKRNEGLPVDVIFLTDGGASHPGHPLHSPAAITALRHREAREALAILGVETGSSHFLDEPDGTLNQIEPGRRAALIDRIAVHLETLRPDEIFLPCNPDGSSEHDAAFGLITEALHCSGLRPTVWQYPVWSWYNPMLLLERIIFTADRCQIPTEDYQLIKTRALGCYRTQMHPLPPQTTAALPPELVRIFNSEVEYFFRFNLPDAHTVFNSPPEIV